MTDYVQVSTTADSREVAMDLARSAVQSKLAASAQIYGPVASVFWHLGEFGEGEEWQVWLKTTAAQYPQLERRLIERHPWENPEVTAVPIVEGAARYLEWLSRAAAPAA
jgi:periplasmic divalent cation tolerance protein